MIILGIHSSGAQLAVAVVSGEKPLAETILPPARTHLERLAPLIVETLEALSLDATDLDGFGVALGPGSFSGIRVGLATAKGIAAALGKPIVGISSLEIIAWRALRAGETGVPLLDARRGEVYAAVYRREDGEMTQLRGAVLWRASALDEFSANIKGTPIFCGDVSLAAGSFQSKVPVFRAVTGPSAAWAARLAAQRLEAGHDGDPHALVPLYVRKSDAENKTRPLSTSRTIVGRGGVEGVTP